jgi:threonylcarbamoyladenosine tRNA methylthiotransferase MtaB
MDLVTPQYQFKIITHGCKVNTYDSGLLEKRFKASAFFSAQEQGPAHMVYIINTCAVTAEATKESAREVRKLKSKFPDSTVVVAGCGAQVDGAVYDDMPGADLVIGNSHKGQIESILDRYFKGQIDQKVFRSNIFHKEDLESEGGHESSHTRAFVKVQDGCNSFCSYCVIPFARGKSRSISIETLVEKINGLVSAGTAEVVLSGVHIADYESGGGLGLTDLVKAILNQTELSRLRISSLEPKELSDELLELYQDPRLCPHFHLSVQSASDPVLRAMGRHYLSQDVSNVLSKIYAKLPGAFVGIDIIAGFPIETETEFLQTFEFLSQHPWTRLHVFPYSERPGTKALKLDANVPVATRQARATRLRMLSAERYTKTAQLQIGKSLPALMLRAGGAKKAADIEATSSGLVHDISFSDPGYFELLTNSYWRVRIPTESVATENMGRSDAFRAGRVHRVKVVGIEPQLASRMDLILTGELA